MPSNETIFKILVICLSLLWGFFESRAGVRNRRTEGKSADRGSYFWVHFSTSVSSTAASILSLIGIAPLAHHWIFAPIGLLLMIGGFLFRWNAMRVLDRYFTHRVTIVNDHQLITAGPYRYLRHPAYFGQIVLMLGFGIALTDATSVAVAVIPMLIALAVRIRIEERALLGHFGDAYARYCARTRRLIPFVW